MTSTAQANETSLYARNWGQTLRGYRKADAVRASYELAVTLIPFVLAWALLLFAWENGHGWLYALLLLPAAGLLVRLFMVQHDCGHGSFFPHKGANDSLGRILSVATLTPYDHWRRSHAAHHAASGNLERRGIGDIYTLTVAEYLARSRTGRLRYRLYRHPSVMFGIGPLYLFLLQNRLPIGYMRSGWMPWLSTMATNVAIVGTAGAMISAIGLPAFLAVHAPIVLLASAAGVWLFYVQHQFERTHWATSARWNAQDAALYGSSHYDLPRPLRWLTANIGIHHVHHLASRIPYYRLPEALRNHPELRGGRRLTLRQSLGGLRLALWDEEHGRLVSFKELRARRLPESRRRPSDR